MSNYKIIAATWWTPPIVGLLYDALTGISSNLSVGAVAIETQQGKKWKAYLGYGTTGNEEIDQQSIAANGVKVSKSEAAGMFPELDIEDFVF
jgi:hypothetical protein